MIQDDDVHAARCEPPHLRRCRRAAIHRDQQLRLMRRNTRLHSALTEAVALLHAVRQIATDLRAQRSQQLTKLCRRRHAIHVVVAEDDDLPTLLNRRKDARDGSLHVRQQERIAEIGQPGFEKARRRFRRAVATIDEHLGKRRRDVKRVSELLLQCGIGRRDEPAAFHAAEQTPATGTGQARRVSLSCPAEPRSWH